MVKAGIRAFMTPDRRCGYFAGRRARDLVLDPFHPGLAGLYPGALAAGFRRAGGHLYRPYCEGCTACQPMRVDVLAFRADRSQRRCLRANAELGPFRLLPAPSAEHFALYRRYVRHRHPGGGMDGMDRAEFETFVHATWSPTCMAELRDPSGRLLAVAVTDVLEDGLSAVYTFFEPEQARRSLGTLCILRQIEWARRSGRRWLYLGFYIAGHAKMGYKARFRPAEVLRDGRWWPLPEDPSLSPPSRP
ncbi:MAG: putative arginyl-tRNA--protein transferase [Lysobacteraceae bacterium]|nr:MAG: putative arginyl-tRNA--protein transferase [Xanthomonadaceae bacterium]